MDPKATASSKLEKDMTDQMSLGDRIRPLRNVAQLALLIRRLEDRQHGLPGMGVFHGPTGFGKSFAAIHAAVSLNAIHISIQDTWTKKTVLQSILRELGISFTNRQTLPDLMVEVNMGLAIAGRPLIIDEADYAVDRGMIQMIRDFHDGSSMPVILIGMENLPQNLKEWQLVDGRILDWIGAQPTDLQDARELTKVYAAGIKITDDLLQHIVDTNYGSARRIGVDLAYVNEQSKLQGVKGMSLDEWGNAPFLRGEAPQPRQGFK